MKTFRQLFIEADQALIDKKYSDVENKIITFFVNNPNPKDPAIHGLSDKLGIDTHEFEGSIYKILSSLIHMKGSDKPDSDFDPAELKKGIEIEHEHHDHDLIARNIAKAHLSEIPDYYTRLVKMETEANPKKEK